MVAFSTGALLLALRVLITAAPSTAAPVAAPAPQAPAPAAGTGYWLADIKRQGVAPYNPNKDAYKVFRNVKDYGAVGDGTTDDTAAINKAVADGERCGEGCDSSTTTPAIVYFPAGTYAVSGIDPNRASALHRNFSKPPIPGCHHRYQDSASVQIQPKWNAPCLFMFHPAETCFRGTARGLGSAVVQRCTAWDRLVLPRIRDVSEPLRRLPTWTVGVCDGRRLGRGVRLRVR